MEGHTPQEQERGVMPQPPEVDRRLRFSRGQLLGLLLLGLIPVLALTGLFGDSEAHVFAAADGLELRVRYPTRTRYHLVGALVVDVRNSGGRERRDVVLQVTRDYLEGFGPTAMDPPPTRLTETHYVLDLGDLPPGASRGLVVQISAHRYLSIKGVVSVHADGRPAVSYPVESFVYP